MKKFTILMMLLLVTATFSTIYSQNETPTPKPEHGKKFIDKNGDGYNDNAPDHDGDGIPNGLDPDFKGAKMQKNKFVDLDGDGINDNAGKGRKSKKGFGNNSGKGKGLKMQDETTEQGTGKSGQKSNRGYRGGNK
ncbi:MAG: hypothetical protein KF816_08030 [Melioribacteraceae bacterium]|jgi:hypothetical protein|nr:hypothetical protein [Melioribacteraceae bacterium]